MQLRYPSGISDTSCGVGPVLFYIFALPASLDVAHSVNLGYKTCLQLVFSGYSTLLFYTFAVILVWFWEEVSVTSIYSVAILDLVLSFDINLNIIKL